MQKAVEQCVEVLRAGGLILYPTDTVWGIGCDATNEEAVQRIYALKHLHLRRLRFSGQFIMRSMRKRPRLCTRSSSTTGK